MVTIVSRELVADEAHYHRSCYQLYIKDADATTASNVVEGDSDNAETQCEVAKKQSYIELFSFARGALFVHPDVVQLTGLPSRLVPSMHSLGVTQVKPSTKKYIRHRPSLEKHCIYFQTRENSPCILTAVP